jgi:hypothetical protein
MLVLRVNPLKKLKIFRNQYMALALFSKQSDSESWENPRYNEHAPYTEVQNSSLKNMNRSIKAVLSESKISTRQTEVKRKEVNQCIKVHVINVRSLLHEDSLSLISSSVI